MKKNLVKVMLLLMSACFCMYVGVSRDSIMPFIWGLLFILAIPGFWKSLKRVFRFSFSLAIVISVGMVISSLSFPLLGVIASGYLVLHSYQEAWGFDPYRSHLLESTKE